MVGLPELHIALSALTEGQLEQLRLPPVRRFDQRAMACLRDHVFHWVENIIRQRYRPGEAPPCHGVDILHELDSDLLELRFYIYDGQQLRYARGSLIDARTLSLLQFDRICQMYFDGAAEAFNHRPMDRFDWQSDVELRNRIDDCLRGLLPAPSAREWSLGVDLGRDASYTVVQRRVVDGSYLEEAAPLTATQMRALQARPLRAEFECDWLGASFADRRIAEERGEKLLREWLSPAQLAQYDREKQFEVIGCHSKRRYRIARAPSFNVLLLDSGGEVEEQICFMPEGNLVPGDQLLAQKVALETDENGAMAVANRQWRGPPMAGMLRALSNLINPFTT